MFVRIILFHLLIVDNYLCLSTSSRDATNKASITIPKTPPTKNPKKKPITLPIYSPLINYNGSRRVIYNMTFPVLVIK